MLDTAADLMSHLLLGTVESLDLPPDFNQAASDRYGALGLWLADEEHGGWVIYTQGSIRLGTVVLPSAPNGEYDIDLVCLSNLTKDEITQVDLKRTSGKAMEEFVTVHRGMPLGPTSQKEGRRCWTLLYKGLRFHLDALPAIRDLEGSATSILIPDRELHLWQHSNPIGYANWFRARMETEWLRTREALAKALRADIEAVPDWRVKTTLQRAVQVFKRHRDIYFATNVDARPPSILLTTLAAHAYKGEQVLFEAVVEAANALPGFIEQRNGVSWVPNPVQPEENFAEKWRQHPERRHHFQAWIETLRSDLAEASQERGLDEVAIRLARSFGEQPVAKAAKGLGGQFRTTRGRGDLKFSAPTGGLGTLGGAVVRKHGFYGASPEAPSA